MIDYFVRYHDKLLSALAEHVQLVLFALFFSLILAAVLTALCIYYRIISKLMLSLTSILYSVPSLAMFAILIPVTGLGRRTAIIVLVIYNQYLLLRNFLTGLSEVDPAIVESATGMGMRKWQILVFVQIPLAKRALFAGVRIAIISTIGIATIAASINAGGLGTILFDGLRTMNVNKIVWGSILSAGLAIVLNYLLNYLELVLSQRNEKK